MIRFNPDIELNYNAEIIYNDIVCLKPYELYCTIDNNLSNIGAGFSVFVVDKCNKIIDNITTQFIQSNFTAFEFYLTKNYYRPVKLMILSNNLKYYSNYFTCKENNLTFRIDFKNKNEIYQSCRYGGFFTNLEFESDVKTYIQETGKKVSNKAILTRFKNFIFDKLDNFNYENICYALSNEFVYIDSERVTDKPLPKTAEIQGSSNFFSSNLKCAIDKNDIYNSQPQIFQQLQLIDYLPKGTYLIGTLYPNYLFEWNYNIELISAEPISVTINGGSTILLQNSDLTITGNKVTSPILGIQDESCEVFIPANKFKNEFGLKNIAYTLYFQKINADFNKLDFNNNDFLTN